MDGYELETDNHTCSGNNSFMAYMPLKNSHIIIAIMGGNLIYFLSHLCSLKLQLNVNVILEKSIIYICDRI